MLEFDYTARNDLGEDVVGTISAPSKRDALHALAEQSLFPLQVESAQANKSPWRPVRRRVSTRALTTNLTQLADLLDSGVPLLRSLRVLADQAVYPELARVLGAVHDQVADGRPLDEALAQHPHVFSELTVSMVRAGAEGGFLEDALKRTADFLEQQDELKARVVGAMTYPAILASAGLTVTVVLLVFFVPKFAELFARLEQRGGLPTATVWLLWLSNTLGSFYGVLLLVALVGLAAWLGRELQTPRGRLLADRWRLKIPIAGSIFLGFALSRFCRILGTLLRNGVPLLKSLEISSDSTGNRVLAQAILSSAENISSGDTLSRPLAQSGIIPRPIMAMISVAEESNRLEDVLITIADGIDRQVSRQLDLMVRVVEPLMLLIMACVILFVLVALLLPVFEMSTALG
ncbi:MAG: pilus assembly protein PilC [Planctomycetes bacterium RBG_16_64_10]|nr:MAG: pilus assembly protein PilC [Planctomycetes bacterium RBG_16_64_10]